MLFLVTRPQPGADETAARLRARGHEVLVDALTRIEYAAEPDIDETPAAIAITSRNGVRALGLWGAAKAWRDLPLFAVGESSAAAARDAGFRRIETADGDVGHLAALIRRRFASGAGPVLYPAARDRAGDLAGELAAAGIRTVMVEAYRAVAADRFEPAVAAALRAGAVDAVLFHSRRSANVFVDLAVAVGLGDRVRSARLVALSARVAEPLAALGTATVAVAVRPDEAALIDLAAGPAKDGPTTIRPL